MCDIKGGFKELDIPTRKQVNSFNVKNAVCCVVTNDNKSLITAENKKYCFLTKWSVRSNKQLHRWQSRIRYSVLS